MRPWPAIAAVGFVTCCALAGAQPAPVVVSAPATPAIRVAPIPPEVATQCMNGTVIMRPSPEAVDECVRGMRVVPADPALGTPVKARHTERPGRPLFDLHRQPYPPRVLPSLPPDLRWPNGPTYRFFTDPRSILQPRHGWPGLKLDVPDAVAPERPR